MINHTDNYEEAKVIIKNSINDDFAKKVSLSGNNVQQTLSLDITDKDGVLSVF